MIQKLHQRQFRWQFPLLVCLCLARSVSGEGPKILYEPPPGWVRELAWSAPTNWQSTGDSEETRCLLYEEQDRPKTAETFFRIVSRMENESGVQDSGSLSFSFDPAFQELLLHRVVIHRDGKTIDRLDPSKVSLIQPEPDLSGNVMTGVQKAVLFVEDLRVGDVLEYAYTLRGANPILGGHYSTRFIIQSDVAVDNQLFRVVCDDKTPLQLRLYRSTTRPDIRSWNGGIEYDWTYTNLTAIPDEDHQPADYEPYPCVELSDFADWRSVVNWALPLYEGGPTNLPPDLGALVDHWKSSARSDEEKARLALDFVQDDVRYTGVELGPDSYQPTDPVETFRKRFGDCKGKSVLLCLLLRQMQIESYPALVNSSVFGAVENRLPTALAFDHAIVQVKLDGETVWVDPTESHQGGQVWNRYLPAYGKALVIRPGTAALENIPLSWPQNAWQQRATATFIIKDYHRPVDFTVRTEYRGASADGMRDYLSSTAPSDVAKSYLNYYTRLYSGIGESSPLKITDDRPANVLVVKEFYTITNLWKWDGSDKLWKTEFYADNLYRALTDPNTRLRKSPLALDYPLEREQENIVHLPDMGWQIPDLQTNIENDAFSFHYHRQLRGSMATYFYDCRTRAATVPVAQVPLYLAARDRMEDLLEDTLQRSDGTGNDTKPTAEGVNWLMVVIAVFGVGVTAALCLWYWRHLQAGTAAAPPVLPDNLRLQGLGGWLILVGIGLCVSPFVRLTTLGQNWEGYFSLQVWQTVAVPGGKSYNPLYGLLLIFEMLGNIVLFGFNLLALFLFFGKRRAFPGVFIMLMLGQAFFPILDDAGVALIPTLKATDAGTDHSEAIRAVLAAIVWCLYTIKSRRVKATFIR